MTGTDEATMSERGTDAEFYWAVVNFMDLFELVFGRDWEHTKAALGAGHDANVYIAVDGTFIEPKVDDEVNKWWNRGSLLAQYRYLRLMMLQHHERTRLGSAEDRNRVS